MPCGAPFWHSIHGLDWVRFFCSGVFFGGVMHFVGAGLLLGLVHCWLSFEALFLMWTHHQCDFLMVSITVGFIQVGLVLIWGFIVA